MDVLKHSTEKVSKKQNMNHQKLRNSKQNPVKMHENETTCNKLQQHGMKWRKNEEHIGTWRKVQTMRGNGGTWIKHDQA
jgi:hypothetical protein